jgi:dynein heavy chain
VSVLVYSMPAGSFKPRPNPAATWLPDSSWQQLLRLSALPAFAGLAEAIAADPPAWQAVYDAAEPHRDRLPGIYNSLGDFRKLLVVRWVPLGLFWRVSCFCAVHV